MKAALLAVGIFLGLSTAHAAKPPVPAAAKFSFFVNQNGKLKPAFNSTARAPLSAVYMMDDYALCYKGSIPQVVSLFSTMMDIFNAQNPHAGISAKLIPFQNSKGKWFVKIRFNQNGYKFGYPSVRECVR